MAAILAYYRGKRQDIGENTVPYGFGDLVGFGDPWGSKKPHTQPVSPPPHWDRSSRLQSHPLALWNYTTKGRVQFWVMVSGGFQTFVFQGGLSCTSQHIRRGELKQRHPHIWASSGTSSSPRSAGRTVHNMWDLPARIKFKTIVCDIIPKSIFLISLV